MRLFNPTDRKAEIALRMDTVTHGVLTDLEGRPSDAVKAKGEVLQVPANPKQIVTLRLT